MEHISGKKEKSTDNNKVVEIEQSTSLTEEYAHPKQSFMPGTGEYEELSAQGAAAIRCNSSLSTGTSASSLANVMMMQHDAIPPARYTSMQEMTEDFWRERKRKMSRIPEEEMKTKTRNMSVPMARVKKIMRIDDDVRNFMISSDAPIFMAQAAEFFIEEMTAMGWQYVSEARRRILQKTDIATAVKNNDQFDFLIDFLPSKTEKNEPSTSQFSGVPAKNTNNLNAQNGRSVDNRRSSGQHDRQSSQHVKSGTGRKDAEDVSINTSEAPPKASSISNPDHEFVAPTVPGTSFSRHQKK